MTSITTAGTKGETSGVLIVDGFRITVGDEGDLTITDITDPNAESINFNIEGIGFEDLSLNGDTLALLDEGCKGTDARVYTLSLKELQNYAFPDPTLGESPEPNIRSFNLSDSGNLEGFTKNGTLIMVGKARTTATKDLPILKTEQKYSPHVNIQSKMVDLVSTESMETLITVS